MKLMFGAAALALLAGNASAATFTVLDLIGATEVQTTQGAYYAGAFDVDADSDGVGDFLAWCLEIGVSFQDGQEYAATALDNSRLSALFNGAYGNVDLGSKTDVAGFQLAVWEAVEEGAGNGLDVSVDDFSVSSALQFVNGAPTTDVTSAVLAAANGFLADAAAWDGVVRYTLTQYSSDNSQNVVGVSPVPLPAAGLMALVAFAGLGAVGRRRKPA
ncbi:MAG: VPLPA-CTERM sorting domain-containing protein [Pikeienuella sp.]